MNAEFIVSEMFGTHFLRVPKECVKMWGGAKTLFFAYLYDIANFAKLQGEDSFYCTYSKIENDLGYDRHTISKYFKFFIELGILKKCENNSLKDRIFYQINCEAIVAMVKNHIVSNSKNNTFDSVKNPLVAVEKSHLGGVENSHSYNNKESIKTDSIITNSAERILPKKIDSNLTFDYLAYAKEKFENANDKPKVSLNLWLEFIKSKKLVLKKYRRKAITAKMIDLNFAELYKLSEIGVNLNERLNKAIADEWQGIWFASDSKEWQKRGGHFRNNVGHLDYDQSKNVDNPLRAIETHIKL